MSSIESTLHDALTWLRPAWDVIARLATTLWNRALSLWSEVRDRHERLMDSDPRYPVALAAGGGAAVKVLITNPAVVNAVTGLLTDLLGVQDPPRQLPSSTWRPAPSWQSRQLGSPLWERDDWDQE